ncbi:MAG TPA: PilZ domain-containing protein [Pseudodesulfovibrio sp.]|nr:PilZ domain-containing protein [Pseudodesulfovibrio sp.]
MEHRWSSRKAMEFDVTVESQGRRITARSRDVGLEGMFLQTSAHRLPENTAVDLVFALGEGRRARTQRIRACVVRRGHNGVAVMFLEFTAEAFRYFEELLYVAPPPGVGPPGPPRRQGLQRGSVRSGQTRQRGPLRPVPF